MRVFLDLHTGARPFTWLNFEIHCYRSLRRDRDLLLHERTLLWMPCHKLVDPRRDIRNCELARLVRQRVVRIVHRISEALHICMKPTLHVEGAADFRDAVWVSCI